MAAVASGVGALLRRRAGLAYRLLWLFPLVAVAQTAAHFSVLFLLAGGSRGSLYQRLHSLVTAGDWTHRYMFIGLGAALTGALAGLGVAAIVARLRYSTGRWQRIGPLNGRRETWS